MDTLKRKQGPISAKATKKSRIASSTPLESQLDDFRIELKGLENEAIASSTKLNNISRMLDLLRTTQGVQCRIVMAAICRTLCRLFANGLFVPIDEGAKSNALITKWLRARLGEYRSILIQLTKNSDVETSLLALDLYMQLSQLEVLHVPSSNTPRLLRDLLPVLVFAILDSQNASHLQTHFITSYAHRYSDVKYYALQALGDFSLAKSEGASIDGRITFLCDLTNASDIRLQDLFYSTLGKENARVGFAPKLLKKEAGETWLSILSQQMSISQRKRILSLIPNQIAVSVDRIERLSDFIDDSFNIGGSISLTSLSGIYHLMQEKNLDYPDFYQKVYALLQPATLHSKHRSRFLRLLDTFLTSTHLPAALVASFIKRLSRLCLHCPPSVIVATLPFIYNLLKTHPACTFMIQRQARTRGVGQSLGVHSALEDPFDAFENDPMTTQAIKSSLWEVETLQAHYHPNVATICKIISEQFTKQAYNLEDFLDHSYASVLASELSKDVKKLPVIEYDIPQRVFYVQDGRSDDSVASLWAF